MSDDPPIYRRSIVETPHSSIEKIGMEGSRGVFYPSMFALPVREKKRRTGEAERPMTAHLPKGSEECEEQSPSPQEAMKGQQLVLAAPRALKYNEALGHAYNRSLPRIQRTEKKGNCCICNRGTHLLWSTGPIDYRLCQGCAKRRGGIYLSTIRMFFS